MSIVKTIDLGYYVAHGQQAHFVSDGRLVVMKDKDEMIIFSNATLEQTIKTIKFEGIREKRTASAIRFFLTKNHKYACVNVTDTLYVLNLETYEYTKQDGVVEAIAFSGSKILCHIEYKDRDFHIFDLETKTKQMIETKFQSSLIPHEYFEERKILFASLNRENRRMFQIVFPSEFNLYPIPMHVNFTDDYVFQSKINGPLILTSKSTWSVVQKQERTNYRLNTQNKEQENPRFRLVCGGEFAIGFMENYRDLVLFDMGKNKVVQRIGTFENIYPSNVLVSPDLKYAAVVFLSKEFQPKIHAIELKLTNVPFVALNTYKIDEKTYANSRQSILFSTGLIANASLENIGFYFEDHLDAPYTKSLHTCTITPETKAYAEEKKENEVTIKPIVMSNGDTRKTEFKVCGTVEEWQSAIAIVQEELLMEPEKRSLTMDQAKTRYNFRYIMTFEILKKNPVYTLARKELLEIIQGYTN